MLKKGLIWFGIVLIILISVCAFIFIPRTNADKEDFSYDMNVSYIGESKINVRVELKNESFHTIRYASNVGGPIFIIECNEIKTTCYACENRKDFLLGMKKPPCYNWFGSDSQNNLTGGTING